MKIYIVYVSSADSYSSIGTIDKVFGTKESARKYVEQEKGDYMKSYEVAEYEVLE